jgi:cytidylate kinase
MGRDLARAVGYAYIDSGAMYRAVTLYALRNCLFENDGVDVERLREGVGTADISFRVDRGTGRTATYLNGEDVEEEIRGMDVAARVSLVASLGFVRRVLVARQQAMGRDRGVVMDGRDIGTVVFPDAELKVFVTASAAIRAQRRVAELRLRGQEVRYEDVLANVRERDRLDMNREESPLRRAADAVELDNSHMTIHEQQTWLLERFRRATGE